MISINYPFIETRNSSLFLVPLILDSKNSIASMEFISARYFLKIHSLDNSSLSIRRSSLLVPDAVTSIAGYILLFDNFLSS